MSGHFMFFAAAEVAALFMTCSFVPLLSLVFIVILTKADKSLMGIAIAGDQTVTFVAKAVFLSMPVVFVSALAYFYVTV